MLPKGAIALQQRLEQDAMILCPLNPPITNDIENKLIILIKPKKDILNAHASKFDQQFS